VLGGLLPRWPRVERGELLSDHSAAEANPFAPYPTHAA